MVAMIIQTLMSVTETAQHDPEVSQKTWAKLTLSQSSHVFDLLCSQSAVTLHSVSKLDCNTNCKGKKRKKKYFKGGFYHFFSKTPTIVVKFPSSVFPSLLKMKISMIPDSDSGMKFWMCPRVIITLGNFLPKIDACSSEVQYLNPYFFK